MAASLTALSGCASDSASPAASSSALPSAPAGQYRTFKVTLSAGVYKITFTPVGGIVGSGVSGSGTASGEAACLHDDVSGTVPASTPDTFTVTVVPGGVGYFYITYTGSASVSGPTKVGSGGACPAS